MESQKSKQQQPTVLILQVGVEVAREVTSSD